MQHTGSPDAFFRDVLGNLLQHRIPFVIGGAYALAAHTGIHRATKDLDILCKREDVPRIFASFWDRPYLCEHLYPHWLAKVHCGEHFVDIAHNSGNGIAPVDEHFFARAHPTQLFGMEVSVCPVEEMIWTKAFIMERERFDGADIAHLLRARAGSIDWAWLLGRFGNHHRLLLCHLVLYGYVYPEQRGAIPSAVMEGLIERVMRESAEPGSDDHVCRGTLVSRQQYLVDITHGGYRDARLAAGAMSEEEINVWTRAIGSDRQ